MKGGDISNEVPQRVIVTLDCIIDRRPIVTKKFGFISTVQDEVSYSRLALARFWKFAQDYGYSLELAGFGYTKKEMKEILEDLDNMGTNPFNYATAYRAIADLVSELPYRPDVKNVIDIPSRGMRYGHWFLEIERT
jgi:hypothetical protein